MLEIATTTGYKIYPFSDESGPFEEYIEVYFDVEHLKPEDRRTMRLHFDARKALLLSETRLLVDALEHGMRLIAASHHEKLKKELEELKKKVREKEQK